LFYCPGGAEEFRPALDAIAAGTLSATVFQDPVGQGTQVVTAASKILAGEAVAPQVLIPFKLVTKENVSSFK
jgi:inositol transport system substrate-binding protein